MTWSLCRRGEGRLSQTRSKMDDAKDVYEEKRLFGPFHGLTMNYEGSNRFIKYCLYTLYSLKAGSQIDAKALRCVALNFASGENIEFAQDFSI